MEKIEKITNPFELENLSLAIHKIDGELNSEYEKHNQAPTSKNESAFISFFTGSDIGNSVKLEAYMDNKWLHLQNGHQSKLPKNIEISPEIASLIYTAHTSFKNKKAEIQNEETKRANRNFPLSMASYAWAIFFPNPLSIKVAAIRFVKETEGNPEYYNKLDALTKETNPIFGHILESYLLEESEPGKFVLTLQKGTVERDSRTNGRNLSTFSVHKNHGGISSKLNPSNLPTPPTKQQGGGYGGRGGGTRTNPLDKDARNPLNKKPSSDEDAQAS